MVLIAGVVLIFDLDLDIVAFGGVGSADPVSDH